MGAKIYQQQKKKKTTCGRNQHALRFLHQSWEQEIQELRLLPPNQAQGKSQTAEAVHSLNQNSPSQDPGNHDYTPLSGLHL